MHLCLWSTHTSMDVWHVKHQLEFSPVTPGFSCWHWLKGFFSSLRFYFPWVTWVSHHRVSDIGQVFTAKSSIYFKNFYLFFIMKYFPFVTKEKNTRYFGFWWFKDIRSKNTPHTVPVVCRNYTPSHGGTSFHDGATYNILYCVAALISYRRNKIIVLFSIPPTWLWRIPSKIIIRFYGLGQWAICITYLMALDSMPGQATFGKDMLCNIPYLDDWK